MSNIETKEALGSITRESSCLSGASDTQIQIIAGLVAGIVGKLDFTAGFNPSSIPAAIKPLTELPDGECGVFSSVSQGWEWLNPIGIIPQEQRLNLDQRNHVDDLDQLCLQVQQCIDGISTIESEANDGAIAIAETLTSMLKVAGAVPQLSIGAAIAATVIDGLMCISSLIDDRNQSIGDCYEELRCLCDDVSAKEPPEVKKYAAEPPPQPEKAAPPKPAPPKPVPPTVTAVTDTTEQAAPQPVQQPEPTPQPTETHRARKARNW